MKTWLRLLLPLALAAAPFPAHGQSSLDAALGLAPPGPHYPPGFDDGVAAARRAYDFANAMAPDAVATGRSANGTADAAGNTFDTMNDLDREVDAAASGVEAGAPPVPASCLGREGCEECYQRPYEQLARSRILLARARALHAATHRFAKAAQAFGDGVAPSTREAAIVWHYQKPKIAASLAQLDATYDRKIADMLAVLKRTLEEIAACEARFYQNPDWYQRYGFMYFEFMQARYQRDPAG